MNLTPRNFNEQFYFVDTNKPRGKFIIIKVEVKVVNRFCRKIICCLGGSSLFKAAKDQLSLTHFGCLRNFIRPNLVEGRVGRLFRKYLSKSFKA